MKGQEGVEKSLSIAELNLSSKLEFPCVEYVCAIGKMMLCITKTM